MKLSFVLRLTPLILFLASALPGCAIFHPGGQAVELESPSGDAPASRAIEQLPHGADLETIAIVGTNDIHGTLVPTEAKTKEEGSLSPVSYRFGGLAYLASYLNILRDELGPRLMWLDAGDEFQGSIESNTEGGAPLVAFFNAEGLTAAAIGNHEFDFGATPANPGDLLGVLKQRMLEAHYPYLDANVRDLATSGPAALPNSRGSQIFGVGGLRIGVIGLSTVSTPTTTRAQNVETLTFTSPKDAVIREAASLRAQGANAVVIVAHAGTRCETGRVTPGLSIRKPTDPLGECDPKGEIDELLGALPAGTVDAVVAGHTHQVIHHWISGVPVIEGGAYGRYFNIIYLTFDRAKHRFIPELARIEGPVPVCPQIFANQHDCNGDRHPPAPRFGASPSNNGRGELVTPEYHGQKISADSTTEKLMADAIHRTADVKARVVGQAARVITHERFAESELGDLVADALRESAGPPGAPVDVALVNSGGIRTPLEPGTITYGDVFRSVPFENAIVTVRLTGAELKLMLRIAESGSRGFAGISGVKLRLVSPQSDVPGTDLNDDGKIEAWELDRLLDARMIDGSPIDPKREYRLATLDFLVTGGDDLGWFFSQIPASRIQMNGGRLERDALVDHLVRLSASGPINSVASPIIDPKNPRLEFVKLESKKAKRRLGGKGRRHRHRKQAATAD